MAQDYLICKILSRYKVQLPNLDGYTVAGVKKSMLEKGGNFCNKVIWKPMKKSWLKNQKIFN